MWWKSLASFARARHRPHNPVSQVEEVQVGIGGELNRPIHLVPITSGEADTDLLGGLAAELARTFGVSCHIEEDSLDPVFAFNAQRGQYWATALLERLTTLPLPAGRIIGVASEDLFVPVLTFVFGEAQLQGHCALVSYYRLIEPGRSDLLPGRLAKEAIHELGHTFGLRHCDDWNCVMSSSHAVERLDIKSARFCSRCKQAMQSRM